MRKCGVGGSVTKDNQRRKATGGLKPASYQYTRRLSKRIDRMNDRIRRQNAEILALQEMITDVFSVLDPEIIRSLPTEQQRLNRHLEDSEG